MLLIRIMKFDSFSHFWTKYSFITSNNYISKFPELHKRSNCFYVDLLRKTKPENWKSSIFWDRTSDRHVLTLKNLSKFRNFSHFTGHKLKFLKRHELWKQNGKPTMKLWHTNLKLLVRRLIEKDFKIITFNYRS